MTSTCSNVADNIQSRHNNASSKMKLVINNQFPGIELVSPLYFSNGAVCYLSPDQRVDVGSTMQAIFNIDPDQGLSTIALIYTLQRKNVDHSNEEPMSNEEATCIRLFVSWMFRSPEEIYVVSDLIEYDRDHVWDNVGLLRLTLHYRPVDIQDGTIEETYLMYDNAVLMTRADVTHEEEYYKLEMTISETSIKDDTRRIQYIDLDR
jgi:hypothetical protein